MLRFLCCGYLAGLQVQGLDCAAGWVTSVPARQRRGMPAGVQHYTATVNGYTGPQAAAEDILTSMRKRVVDQTSGILLLPATLGVLGLTGVDLFSSRVPQLQFLYSHGHGQKKSAGRGGGAGGRFRSPLALGVLSLARGGGGSSDDAGGTAGGGGGHGGPLAPPGLASLLRSAVWLVASTVFGLAPCTLCRCVMNPLSCDAELMSAPV
jgi:hypothetical protein